MKRLTILLGLIIPIAHAQYFGPPHFVVGSTIASSLPLASGAANQFWTITDGASSTDCTTGGGSTGVLCYSNGTTWASVGGASSSCANALTMNNSGSGAASGSTFNCSAAVTLSYNTLGAAPLASPTFTGTVTAPLETISGNGAASVSPLLMSGTILTGGTGTTNFPALFIQPTAATAVTNWSTSGTAFGINTASGFTGNFFDFRLNAGSAIYSGDRFGNLTAAASVATPNVVSLSNNTFSLLNTAATLKFYNAAVMSWSSTASYTGANDVGLDRNAAGVLEVNLGTAAGSGGTLKAQGFLSNANCSSSASPAVCAAATAGSVVVAASATTVVVDTTAVTANSQVFVQEDSSLGTKLSVTCNTTPATAPPTISARTGGTSFTITTTAPTTNPRCFSYWLIN